MVRLLSTSRARAQEVIDEVAASPDAREIARALLALAQEPPDPFDQAARDEREMEFLSDVDLPQLCGMLTRDFVAQCIKETLIRLQMSHLVARMDAVRLQNGNLRMRALLGCSILHRRSDVELCTRSESERNCELFVNAEEENWRARTGQLGANAVASANQEPVRNGSSGRNTYVSSSSRGTFDSVQRNLATMFNSEDAKFSGDLQRPPAFDTWEKRLRTYLAAYDLSDEQQVKMLLVALTGPAERYYFSHIVPENARAGAVPGDSNARGTVTAARNCRTLSEALAKLEGHFARPDARQILYSELCELTLVKVMSEAPTTDLAKGMSLLKERILHLSENGPSTYNNTQHQLNVLRNALKNQEWAVNSFLTCTRPPHEQTLEAYCATLVSDARTRDVIIPQQKQHQQQLNGSSGTVAAFENDAEVLYGDTRISKRNRRGVAYRGSAQRSPFRPGNLPSNQHTPRHPQRSAQRSMPDLAQRLRDKRCLRCGQLGHFVAGCTEATPPQKSFRDSIRAYLASDATKNDESVGDVLAYLTHELDVQEEAVVENDYDDSAEAQYTIDLLDKFGAADDPVEDPELNPNSDQGFP